MAQIDDWLAGAARKIPGDVSAATFSMLERRLEQEPSPLAAANRRDARRTMFCAGFAAIAGFWAIGGLQDNVKAGPTWIAVPSQSSPYSLLIGR